MAAGHKIGVEFEQLWDAFPREGQRDLLKAIGGHLPEVEGSASALRLSVALNRVGWALPASDPFTGKEYKDGEGNIVAVSAAALEQLLTRRFGKPHHCKGGRADIAYKAAHKKKGIIFFKPDEGKKIGGDAGFFTLWNGSESPTAEDYWSEAEAGKGVEAYIWEMKD